MLRPIAYRMGIISIHVLREEDDGAARIFTRRIRLISIHVLREEDDPFNAPLYDLTCISIHVLREEDDMASWIRPLYPMTFLSTSSARRTTSAPRCRRRSL